MKPSSIPPKPQHREKLLDLSTEKTINTSAPLLDLAEVAEPLQEEPAADDSVQNDGRGVSACSPEGRDLNGLGQRPRSGASGRADQ